MKLLTAQIVKKLEKTPIYSTEGVELQEKKVICKFFNPIGSGTWYVFEGNKIENGDWEFFGVVDLLDKEMGYFLLSDLQKIELPFGLKIERDISVFNKNYSDFM